MIPIACHVTVTWGISETLVSVLTTVPEVITVRAEESVLTYKTGSNVPVKLVIPVVIVVHVMTDIMLWIIIAVSYGNRSNC